MTDPGTAHRIPDLSETLASSIPMARLFLRGWAGVQAATVAIGVLTTYSNPPGWIRGALALVTFVGLLGFVTAWHSIPTRMFSLRSQFDWSWGIWGGRLAKIALGTLALPERWAALRWITYTALAIVFIAGST